ncbi:MAG TPA: hypothetical protein VJK54_03945, partial [Chthoniobacterales bacterium]|nr:hypothetical protein [Chthoniobacterales bacterium]
RLQGTGNRRQRTDNEKIALSIPEKPENPSFQIGQRVESTTNCQLPTANCDNGIRCHLMMDPSSTSSTLEEGMKALSRFVKPSVYPEEEGAISAAARIKPSTATSNSSSYAKYIVPEETSVAAYGDTERQGQGQIDNVTPETREFEAYFSNTIKRVRAEAEGISQEAEKAVSIAKEKANQSVASVKMWREVIDKATEAEGIYEELVQYCTQYRDYASKHYTGWMLDSKRMQYDLDLKRAEMRKEYWANEIEDAQECLQEVRREAQNQKPSGTTSVPFQPKQSRDPRPPGNSGGNSEFADFEESFNQKIETAKARAEEMITNASAARTKAERGIPSEQLWAEAAEKAGKAEQAYSELLHFYQDYKEKVGNYCPANLVDAMWVKYKGDYERAEEENKRAEDEKNRLIAKAMECIQQKEIQYQETFFSKRIQTAKTIAEATAMIASDARTKAESASALEQTTAEQIWAKRALWIKAAEESAKAEQTYAELLDIYKNYQEHIANCYPKYLIDITQSRYGIDYQQAEAKKKRWNANAMECYQQKEPLRLKTAEKVETSFVQRIEVAKAQAEEKAKIATDAKTKAERVTTSEQLWTEAAVEAGRAEQAYNELLGLYKNYKEQVEGYYPGYLVDAKRGCYNADYKKVETQKNRLNALAKICLQQKEVLQKVALGKLQEEKAQKITLDKRLQYAKEAYEQGAQASAQGKRSLSKIWNHAGDLIKQKALASISELKLAREEEAALEQSEQRTQAKLSFDQAKREWAPVSKAIKTYLANPNVNVDTVYSAGAITQGKTFHHLKGPDGLSNETKVASNVMMSIDDMSVITRAFIRDEVTAVALLGAVGTAVVSFGGWFNVSASDDVVVSPFNGYCHNTYQSFNCSGKGESGYCTDTCIHTNDCMNTYKSNNCDGNGEVGYCTDTCAHKSTNCVSTYQSSNCNGNGGPGSGEPGYCTDTCTHTNSCLSRYISGNCSGHGEPGYCSAAPAPYNQQPCQSCQCNCWVSCTDQSGFCVAPCIINKEGVGPALVQNSGCAFIDSGCWSPGSCAFQSYWLTCSSISPSTTTGCSWCQTYPPNEVGCNWCQTYPQNEVGCNWCQTYPQNEIGCNWCSEPYFHHNAYIPISTPLASVLICCSIIPPIIAFYTTFGTIGDMMCKFFNRGNAPISPEVGIDHEKAEVEGKDSRVSGSASRIYQTALAAVSPLVATYGALNAPLLGAMSAAGVALAADQSVWITPFVAAGGFVVGSMIAPCIGAYTAGDFLGFSKINTHSTTEAALAVFRAHNNSFFNGSFHIPSGANAIAATDAAAQATIAAAQAVGTDWEEETQWAAQTAQEIAEFNQAVAKRK